MCKAAEDLASAFEHLDFDVVLSYCEDEFVDVKPYLVCTVRPREVFNSNIGDVEGPRIGLRFLELKANKVYRHSESYKPFSWKVH